MRSEKAVVPSATKSGRADCARVQRSRRSRDASSPLTRSRRAAFQVSCTTKMLSAVTPVTTQIEAHANAEMGRCLNTTSTMRNVRGSASTSCITAANAKSTLRK